MMLLTGKNPIYRIKKGFSFVELLIVAIILGVIAGLSVPKFSKTYSNLLLVDTSRNLAYLMRYAQARAIAERINYRLNFNQERNKYWLTKGFVSENQDDFERLQGTFGKIFNIPNNLVVICESKFINFYPDGKMDKTNIYLSNNNEKFYTISTEAQSGYVREFDYKR